MGLYSKQGLYAGYKKNNQEREALDYYATPPNEVTNILNILKLDFHGAIILEPCVGGGHMLNGIRQYCLDTDAIPNQIYISDIKERADFSEYSYTTALFGDEADFLGDDYPYNNVDYIIMNPPFITIEPFVIRGLEIAQKGLLMFGRLQFLESKSRYENILKDNPPSDVYVYVDRVKCGKNGDFANTEAIQAYAWFYWDKTSPSCDTKVHWIRRSN